MMVVAHYLLWSFRLAKAETQTSAAERDCLARYAAGKQRLAEIGVWHGVTTCTLKRAMDPGGVLWGVDPFPTGRLGFSVQKKIAQHEVGKVRNGSVRWKRMTGTQAATDLKSAGEKVDFVFIDGDHSYTGLQADWLAWSTLVEISGIVALHDSRSSLARCIDDAGSVRFTREVILRDERFDLVEEVDTLTVLRRRKN